MLTILLKIWASESMMSRLENQFRLIGYWRELLGTTLQCEHLDDAELPNRNCGLLSYTCTYPIYVHFPCCRCQMTVSQVPDDRSAGCLGILTTCRKAIRGYPTQQVCGKILVPYMHVHTNIHSCEGAIM